MAYNPGNDWSQVIHDIAITQMNAWVVFYSSVIDNATQTESISVIWEGKARVQHLREPRDASTVYEVSKLRRYRFQLDPDDEPPFFPSGVTARVLDGGRNPDLELLVYVVDSAVNSSHRAVVTVELTTNMIEYQPLILPSV